MLYQILIQSDTKFMQQIHVLNNPNTYLLDDFDKYSHLLNSERSLLIKAFLVCVNNNIMLKKQNYTHCLPSLINCLFHLSKKTKRIFLDLCIATSNVVGGSVTMLPYMDLVMKYSDSKYKFQLELLSHFMNVFILPELRKVEKQNHRTPNHSTLTNHVKSCITHSDPIVRTLGKDLFLLLSKQEQIIFETHLEPLARKRLNILVKPASTTTSAVKAIPARSTSDLEIDRLLYLLDTNQRIKTLKTLGQLPFNQLEEQTLVKLYHKLVHVTNISTILTKIELHLPMVTCIDILLVEKRWMRIKHVINWDLVDLSMVQKWDSKILQYVDLKDAHPDIQSFYASLNSTKRPVPFTPKKNTEVKRSRVVEQVEDEIDARLDKYQRHDSKDFLEPKSPVLQKHELNPCQSQGMNNKSLATSTAEQRSDCSVKAADLTKIDVSTANTQIDVDVEREQIQTGDHVEAQVSMRAVEPTTTEIEQSVRKLAIRNDLHDRLMDLKDLDTKDAKIINVETLDISGSPSDNANTTTRSIKNTPVKDSMQLNFNSPMMLDTPCHFNKYDSFTDQWQLYYDNSALCQFYLMILENSVSFTKFEYMQQFTANPDCCHSAALVDAMMNSIDKTYLKSCISLLNWTIRQKMPNEAICSNLIQNVSIIYDHLVIKF
eukprot:NODE_35_length_31537_cov_0.293403.p3 type:complete len:658 gc:universal NODE_35_length_31537_cov_0.293403:29076-31049(+)